MAKIIKHPHSYIGYTYFISDDGTIHQGRMDREEAAHCADPNNPHWWNTHSIGICLQGDLTKRKPTREQLNSLGLLVNKLRIKYDIPRSKLKGHQEIVPTLCPGDLINWVKDYRKVV